MHEEVSWRNRVNGGSLPLDGILRYNRILKCFILQLKVAKAGVLAALSGAQRGNEKEQEVGSWRMLPFNLIATGFWIGWQSFEIVDAWIGTSGSSLANGFSMKTFHYSCGILGMRFSARNLRVILALNCELLQRLFRWLSFSGFSSRMD